MTTQLFQIKQQPFDYQCLTDQLRDYRFPRNKIGKLLQNGEIVSLKRGLYLLGGHYGREFSPETVANLLYGPSYVSLEYALGRYGLIPEMVFTVTSVTTGRKKTFDTPVGTFSYRQLKASYYALGYLRQNVGENSHLIALPEKALCDKLYFAPNMNSSEALESYLYEDLRLDPVYLNDFDKKLVRKLSVISGKKNLRLLQELI